MLRVLSVVLMGFVGLAHAQMFENTSVEIQPFARGSTASRGLGGAGWLDYDGDGDLDLYMTNSAGRRNRLFRNDGNGSFTPVGIAAGVANAGGNTGVTIADIDNDGHPDIFLTGDGAIAESGEFATPKKLYVNNGDGTFSDITRTSGIPFPNPGLMATFGDIDNDGYLDLFVAGAEAIFGNGDEGPHKISRLYRNNGDRTFTDITEAAGIVATRGACVSGFNDFDNDGLIDLYVGECVLAKPYQLFRNNGDLTFTEVAASVGLTASSGFWMGIAFGDLDRDGDLDIFSSNVGGLDRPHGLFRRDEFGYTDVAGPAGVANLEFGWGCAIADFDNDTDDDIVIVGAAPAGGFIGPGLDGGNPGRILLNDGAANFSPGQSFGLQWNYTSGLAVADYDADGSSDMVVVTSKMPWTTGKPVLLRNLGNSNHSVTIDLEGVVSNRDGVGAKVRVATSGATQLKLVTAGSSFMSTHSPWLTFGLGSDTTCDVEVTWPSGLNELFANVAADQKITLTEGSGLLVPVGTTNLYPVVAVSK